MTIDIGSETAGAAVVPGTLEKGYATKRECTKTGKLHELAVTVEATNKSTGVKLGIRKDVAGAVGEFIAETAEVPITELKAETVKGALAGGDVEITAGTIYWLCVVPVKGSTFKFKATEKAGFGFKTTGAVKKVSEGTWTTAENKYGEPAPIWGIEAEGGTGLLVTKSAESKVVIGGTEKIVGTAALLTKSAESKVVVGGKQTVGAIAVLTTKSTESKVVIGGKQTLAAIASLAGTTKVVIAGVAAIVGTGGAAFVRKTIAFLFDEEDD